MNPDSARGSATFGHDKVSHLGRDDNAAHTHTPMNASEELEALHMYDSLLLGNTISQSQLKDQIERKRKLNQSISQLRQGSELDVANLSQNQFTLKI